MSLHSPADASCTLFGDSHNQTSVSDRRSGEPVGFKRFWDAWPKHKRKEGRYSCCKKWVQLKLEPIADEIIKALEVWKISEKWMEGGGQYIPLPMTWINQRRWEDIETLSTFCETAIDLETSNLMKSAANGILEFFTSLYNERFKTRYASDKRDKEVSEQLANFFMVKPGQGSFADHFSFDRNLFKQYCLAYFNLDLSRFTGNFMLWGMARNLNRISAMVQPQTVKRIASPDDVRRGTAHGFDPNTGITWSR